MDAVIDSWDAENALDLANIRFQLMYVVPQNAQVMNSPCTGTFGYLIPCSVS